MIVTENAERFVDSLQEEENFSKADLARVRNRLKEVTPAALLDLIRDGFLSRQKICRLWAETIGIAHVDPIQVIVSREAVKKFPFEVARKANAIGLYIFGDCLTVAMSEPRDEVLIGRLEKVAGIKISPVFSLPDEIDDAISIHYQTEEQIEQLSRAQLHNVDIDTEGRLDADRVKALADSGSFSRLVDSVIFFALRERATDIHVQPEETELTIRLRIDGHLREIVRLPKRIAPPLCTRIKILSELDIAQTRLPQDGRFSMDIGGHRAQFRVSVMPSIHGEKVVIRILTVSGMRGVIPLDKMDFSQNILKPLRQLINTPNGAFFVTGPTGSGKTTTLYAALAEISTPRRNILTVEDPIEYQLPGITQIQVNNTAELTFSRVLRSALRQDPDVILVGEIRDQETAKIAAEAALTGHLVFSSLHTNSAIQAMVRLVEIGVEPFLVAPSLIGILSQRLAGRICPNCREPYRPSSALLRHYFHDETFPEVTFYRGKGCYQCRHTGFLGRVAFHELVIINDEMREVIARGGSHRSLAELAVGAGYRSLRYDGLKKVLLGLTTLDEIERLTVSDY